MNTEPEVNVSADASDLQQSQGSPPPTAEQKQLDRYECRSCGYVYEPDKGDNKSEVAAKTPFSELPAGWRCPVCGARKPQFENIGPTGKPSGFEENLRYGLGVNTLTPGQKNILIFGALGLGFLFFLSLYGLR
ncbi:MAG: rubredoxin [Leptolyngbyaceae cyanobacterium SM1_1_3]|nr:rubredoxin [Leptolyngbyaceae cyanobacterium SM1_1_3]NJM84875.1 rubredoxin [Leptolyngbyaceae cyanobacterium RM2_2_21]NJN01825.1 rubredoxin [Leptolyngbyaceae cyanobacterium RM1_1_2]